MEKIIEKVAPMSSPPCNKRHLIGTLLIFKGVGSVIVGIFQNRFYYLLSANKQRYFFD
jgi:hypothetical protein